ncbi:MAG: hypothetical protein CR981_03210 [Proteobacteria bacterium]|nr:MAG: hypothetical protein CR981_03210 [Pseudomonadota bacterium]PIE64486.1 MAG: hypothetical protein CSA26_07735 [Desulfobacterales bacterium]
MKEWCEYLIVTFFLYLFRILPTSWVYLILSWLARLFFQLLKRRRELAIKNLSLAYGESEQKAQYRQLAKKVFLGIARTTAETILIFNGRYDIDQHVKNKELAAEKIRQLAGRSTKGIIIIGAHFGNWELLAHFMAIHGYPGLVVGRAGDNKLIENKMTTPFREKFGNRNVHTGKAMRDITKTLRSGQPVGILFDQKATRANGVKSSFFGKQCGTTTAIATLKLKYDPLIVPGFARRCDDGDYEILIGDPVTYTAEDKDDKKQKIAAMTQRYNDILEDMVRSAPEQWFWVHNRWRIG